MKITTCFMCDPDSHIGQHEMLYVLPNGFPIASLHLLLVTAEHREELRVDDLRSAWDFARRFPDYFVFHNMQDAGATRPEHLHFQALPRGEPLPIEAAARQKLFSLDGATVARVKDYPAYGLAVKGARAPEMAFAVLREIRPAAFNLVMSRQEIIVVPRGKEQPSGFNSLFGGLEMAGCVVMVEEGPYQAAGFDDLWQALAECGWSPERGAEVEETLCGSLLDFKEAESIRAIAPA